jgi:hypothetical protein
VTAAVFFVVLLLFLPEGGPCSTLTIIVLGYAAFSIMVSAIEGAWPRRRLGERARLYHDVAERCLERVAWYWRLEGTLNKEVAWCIQEMVEEMRCGMRQ